MKSKIGCCIVLYNPETKVVNNIATYQAHIDILIVVDNSPRQNLDVVDSIRQIYPGTHYHWMGENKGIASALNTGCNIAISHGCEWLLTMDQDSHFKENEFSQLVDSLQPVLKKFPNTGIVAPYLHTDHLNTVGLLPESYFLYWEETDWCQHAVKSGLTLHVSLKAFCYDKISTTIGRGFLSDYFYTRNGLLFLKKYRSICLLSAVPAVVFRLLIRIFRGETQRAKGMAKGVIDFLTGARYENK